MKLKKSLVGLMLTAALTTIPVTLAACKPASGGTDSSSITQSSDDSSVVEKVPFEATGEYYCVAGESEYTLDRKSVV